MRGGFHTLLYLQNRRHISFLYFFNGIQPLQGYYDFVPVPQAYDVSSLPQSLSVPPKLVPVPISLLPLATASPLSTTSSFPTVSPPEPQCVQLGVNEKYADAMNELPKEYACDSKNCGLKFKSKFSLTRHARKHSGIKPYICDTCQKDFLELTSLTRHRRVHTGEKPFQCDECGREFSDCSNWRRHTEIHTGQRRFVCPDPSCRGEGFTRSGALRRHYANKHAVRVIDSKIFLVLICITPPQRFSVSLYSMKKCHISDV